jgi:GntR family transcriptional regulator
MPRNDTASNGDQRPFHQRIAADLRDEIMSGDLAPGGALPSTAQLKERFEASNATIQKAVGLLKAEGLVTGRPGAAVTVREHRRRVMTPAAYAAAAGPGEPYRWISEATRRGLKAGSRLIDVREAQPPDDVAHALGLDAGGTAVLRLQVLLLDDEPAELVHCYYPLDIARGTPLAQHRKIRGGTPTLLTALGFPPRHCVDLVSACVPTREQYELLGLPGELPVLRTFRVVYGDHERPLEASVMAKAGHLYELRYDFPVTG